MSIELPEAHILALQMTKELIGKTIQAYELQNCRNLQKLGCVNNDTSAFDKLNGNKITAIASRGNVIVVKLSSDFNLVLAPEYGGSILFHQNHNLPAKFHLKLSFPDGTALTVSLNGIGCIQAVSKVDLDKNYLFRRDFSQTTSPLEESSLWSSSYPTWPR